MSKKFITSCMLIITICLLLLGVVFKKTAEDHKGISASTGVMINGKYSELSSGTLGGNTEKYDAFNTGGTVFYIMAGITGVIYLVSVIKKE